MKKYDYRKAVKEDVIQYILDNNISLESDDKCELVEELHHKMWDCDEITGNASSSYTFNTWQAEEYLCHNWDLLLEALETFGEENTNILEKGAEWCDLTIRCYLLFYTISEVVEELA